ncbi:MAG: sugar ABC transporter permease [Clostridia bacterium]|nr:sugar ABC transporter permease [Clostridia bacterium]
MEQTNTVVQEKKTLKKRQKDAIFVACLVALPLIHYTIFYVYVNFNSVLLAFQRYDVVNGIYRFAGFDNFNDIIIKIVNTGLLLSSLKNSLLYYVIHTAVGTTACLLFSYYIFKKRFASKVFKTMLFLPSIISSIALSLMFKYFINDGISAFLQKSIGPDFPILMENPDTIFGVVIFYGVWMGFGTSLLMYSGAMSNISDSVMEAAQIDGAGEFNQFIRIVLPLIYPTITTFLINGVATIFAADMHLYAFYGGSAPDRVATFGYILIKETRSASGDLAGYPYPAAIGLLLTLVTVPLTMLVRWALNKFGPKTV